VKCGKVKPTHIASVVARILTHPNAGIRTGLAKRRISISARRQPADDLFVLSSNAIVSIL